MNVRSLQPLNRHFERFFLSFLTHMGRCCASSLLGMWGIGTTSLCFLCDDVEGGSSCVTDGTGLGLWTKLFRVRRSVLGLEHCSTTGVSPPKIKCFARSILKSRYCIIFFLGNPRLTATFQYSIQAAAAAKSKKWKIALTVHLPVLQRMAYFPITLSKRSIPPMWELYFFTATGCGTSRYRWSFLDHRRHVPKGWIASSVKFWYLED